MTDESIINLSDETKSSLRAYATMAGFFVMAAVFLYGFVAEINGQSAISAPVKIIGSALLLIIGVILAMLHKRDLFATFFILFALVETIHGTSNTLGMGLPVAIIYIVAALALSQTRNEQRYAVVGLLLILAISELMIFSEQFLVAQCAIGIIFIACFYFAFALACERYKLPLRDMLVADEEVPENDGVPVHFKEMGSSIGYLVFALFALIAADRLFGGVTLDQNEFEGIMVVCGIIFMVTGIIMMVAGRMKGTPFYFMCAGFLFLMLSAGLSYVPNICFIILGIMMMLRSDSRILFGSAFVIQGIIGIIGTLVLVDLSVCGALQAVMFILFTYLMFAVNSNGKLKLI